VRHKLKGALGDHFSHVVFSGQTGVYCGRAIYASGVISEDSPICPHCLAAIELELSSIGEILRHGDWLIKLPWPIYSIMLSEIWLSVGPQTAREALSAYVPTLIACETAEAAMEALEALKTMFELADTSKPCEPWPKSST